MPYACQMRQHQSQNVPAHRSHKTLSATTRSIPAASQSARMPCRLGREKSEEPLTSCSRRRSDCHCRLRLRHCGGRHLLQRAGGGRRRPDTGEVESRKRRRLRRSGAADQGGTEHGGPMNNATAYRQGCLPISCCHEGMTADYCRLTNIPPSTRRAAPVT
jgi:hypothetical protein